MDLSVRCSQDFLALAEAVELDTEWHRTVSTQCPVPDRADRFALSSPAGQPCPQCGTLTVAPTKHILNDCDSFTDRYHWRKANLINYVDSILDHNQHKAFCDLPDRRTSSGGTIPQDFQHDSASSAALKPDFFVMDRVNNHIRMFVILICDDAESNERRRVVQEQYAGLLRQLGSRSSGQGSVASLCILDVSSLTGRINDPSKAALYELFKLTTQKVSVNEFIDNVSSLVKIGSFKIYKTSRNELLWERYPTYLYPGKATRRQHHEALIKAYLYPGLKALGLALAAVMVLLLFHVLYQLSGWIWAQLTFKVMIVIYVVLMGLFLSLFRP